MISFLARCFSAGNTPRSCSSSEGKYGNGAHESNDQTAYTNLFTRTFTSLGRGSKCQERMVKGKQELKAIWEFFYGTLNLLLVEEDVVDIQAIRDVDRLRSVVGRLHSVAQEGFQVLKDVLKAVSVECTNKLGYVTPMHTDPNDDNKARIKKMDACVGFFQKNRREYQHGNEIETRRASVEISEQEAAYLKRTLNALFREKEMVEEKYESHRGIGLSGKSTNMLWRNMKRAFGKKPKMTSEKSDMQKNDIQILLLQLEGIHVSQLVKHLGQLIQESHDLWDEISIDGSGTLNLSGQS